ncbi:class I lanthipeptide [Aquimarina sp. D1M17]|uniref:class I lanthipeptide n=1 Tax=Aquimarina acroporae TaxID=2937283 RepID=UPI0020C0EEB2|nr:class I lanthipeptide [Aquimarina acroporae]MCK8524390.1 class I lanthipeptide [Aquimarina acroporae]
MKKKKMSGLSLSKQTISRFNSSQIVGGGHTDNTYGTCTNENTVSCNANGCSFPHPQVTVGQGCTQPTLGLSYCSPGGGVPDGCRSYHPCA